MLAFLHFLRIVRSIEFNFMLRFMSFDVSSFSQQKRCHIENNV